MNATEYFKPFSHGDFIDAIAEFSSLLDSEPSEGAIQEFLQCHAYFLTPVVHVIDTFICVSQPSLGSEYRADFAVYSSCNGPWWTLIELKSPGDKLFNRNGDPSSKLVHACRQAEDWRAWISASPQYFSNNYPDHMRFGHCGLYTTVIIGRRDSLSKPHLRRLSRMNQERHESIVTYDAILEGMNRMRYVRDGAMIQTIAIPYSEYAEVIQDHRFHELIYAHALRDAEFAERRESRAKEGRK